MGRFKGHSGYLKHRKTVLGIELALAAIVTATLLVLSKIGPKDYRTILTVITIVSVLPAANIAVKLIAIWPFKAESQAMRDEVLAVCTSELLNHEMVISCNDQPTAYFPYVSIYPGQVIAYTESKKCDANRFAKYLETMIRDNDAKFDVKIIKERKTFLKRLKELESKAVIRETCDESLLRAEGTLRAISM